MISWLRIALPIAFAAVLLSACAQPLSDETSKQLGSATRAAASALGAPAEIQREAISQAKRNQRICRYLNGSSFQLGQSRQNVSVSPLAIAQERTGILLLAYLEALEEASRGSSIAELAQARQGFQTGVAEFETAATGSTRISPLLTTVGDLISRAGESHRQARIRGIMSETTDALEILSFLVERDVSGAISDSQSAIAVWERSAKCLLKAMRSRPGAIEKYEAFDAQRRGFNAQLVTIQRGPATVNSLVDAHILAGVEEASFEEIIEQIVVVAEETKALVDATEGL